MTGGAESYKNPNPYQNKNANQDKNTFQEKIIPQFTDTVEMPFITHTQKEMYNKNKPQNDENDLYNNGNKQGLTADTFITKKDGDDKVLLNLQLYQPEQKKPPPNKIKQPPIFPFEPLVTTTPYYPPQYQERVQNLMKNMYTPYIYKDYNINIGGPSADHTMASMIYEDLLPKANVYASFKSLKERNNLNNYVRGTFISNEEGEDIQFDGGKNSLNSRLKFTELNPYNSNKYSNNHYAGLANNFLIYRSCYPIFYDKVKSCVQCQKNSVGMNIRIYAITEDEYIIKHPELAKKIKNKPSTNNNDNINDYESNYIRIRNKPVTTLEPYGNGLLAITRQMNGGDSTLVPIASTPSSTPSKPHNFNLWREIEYYEFIRNTICKQLISPNFVQSYCYFINNKTQIKFNKLKNKVAIRTNDNENNRALVLLTESPAYNIIAWGSNSYTKINNIQKQIYDGFKTDNVWKCIIAQMIIVFYVMNKYKFTYTNMELNKNFYIKNLNEIGEVVNYYHYVIDNISYYIPSNNNLLMFDSDYHDNNDGTKYKVISKDLFEDDETDIKQKIEENMTTCITQLSTNKDTGANFIKLPEDALIYIKSILAKIKNSDSDSESDSDLESTSAPTSAPTSTPTSTPTSASTSTPTLAPTSASTSTPTSASTTTTSIDSKFNNKNPNDNIMLFSLNKYLHNRIGTPLDENEFKNTKQHSTNPFKRGEICVHEEDATTFKFVMFYGNSTINQCWIATKDNNKNIDFTEIDKNNLLHYSNYEPVKQTNITLESIIETYYV